MKNKIYYLGIISTVLITIGGIFKIMHWPAAGILLTLGIMNLCLIFFPIAFISSFKNSESKKKWIYIAAFLTLFIVFTGALFKIMHWPGAGNILLVGILIPVVLFLPVYLYHHYKDKEESLKNFMYIMFFLVYLSGMSALLAINVSKSVLGNGIAVAKMNNLSTYYTLKYDTYGELNSNNADELKTKTNNLLNSVNDLKIELLVRGSEDNKAAINENHEIEILKIKTLDMVDIVVQVMLNEEKASILKKELDEYKNFILSISDNSNSELTTFCSEILNTRPTIINDEPVSWEQSNFQNLHLIFAINKLSEIENNIRLAELEALSTLNKKSSINNI